MAVPLGVKIGIIFRQGFFIRPFPSFCHCTCCVCLLFQVTCQTLKTRPTKRAVSHSQAPPKQPWCLLAQPPPWGGLCRPSSPALSKPLCPLTSAPAWAPTRPTPTQALAKVIFPAACSASLPALAKISSLPLGLNFLGVIEEREPLTIQITGLSLERALQYCWKSKI